VRCEYLLTGKEIPVAKVAGYLLASRGCLAAVLRENAGSPSPGSFHSITAVKIEHFALQVADPLAMADWYVKHLGCSVARSGGAPSHGRFLLDDERAVMLEIYRNPKVPVPEYSTLDPQVLHLAFLSEEPAGDRDRLVAAGAQVVDELTTTPAGDEIVMLRDPWGVALQLIKRAIPML
jgi:glyoxylase I family protein